MSLNRSMAARTRLPSASVIGRIEAALEGVADSLANANELKIPFSSRRHRSRPADNEENFVRFPGSSASEARKFGKYPTQQARLLLTRAARLLLIMQLAHQAMITGTILTKRYIAYSFDIIEHLLNPQTHLLPTPRAIRYPKSCRRASRRPSLHARHRPRRPEYCKTNEILRTSG